MRALASFTGSLSSSFSLNGHYSLAAASEQLLLDAAENALRLLRLCTRLRRLDALALIPGRRRLKK